MTIDDYMDIFRAGCTSTDSERRAAAWAALDAARALSLRQPYTVDERTNFNLREKRTRKRYTKVGERV